MGYLARGRRTAAEGDTRLSNGAAALGRRRSGSLREEAVAALRRIGSFGSTGPHDDPRAKRASILSRDRPSSVTSIDENEEVAAFDAERPRRHSFDPLNEPPPDQPSKRLSFGERLVVRRPSITLASWSRRGRSERDCGDGRQPVSAVMAAVAASGGASVGAWAGGRGAVLVDGDPDNRSEDTASPICHSQGSSAVGQSIGQRRAAPTPRSYPRVAPHALGEANELTAAKPSRWLPRRRPKQVGGREGHGARDLGSALDAVAPPKLAGAPANGHEANSAHIETKNGSARQLSGSSRGPDERQRQSPRSLRSQADDYLRNSRSVDHDLEEKMLEEQLASGVGGAQAEAALHIKRQGTKDADVSRELLASVPRQADVAVKATAFAARLKRLSSREQ